MALKNPIRGVDVNRLEYTAFSYLLYDQSLKLAKKGFDGVLMAFVCNRFKMSWTIW